MTWANLREQEISPPKIRGRVGMLNGLNNCFGYFVTEWLGLAFFFIPGQASWRVLFGLQIVPTVIMGVGSFWVPESPRWLALKGRYDETLAVLKRIHQGVDDQHVTGSSAEELYKLEYQQIRAQIELDKAEHLGLKDILRRPSYRKRLLIVIVYFIFQQVTLVMPPKYLSANEIASAADWCHSSSKLPSDHLWYRGPQQRHVSCYGGNLGHMDHALGFRLELEF